ncbi:MAG: OsmC family protein [Pseudomonadota bacterium]
MTHRYSVSLEWTGNLGPGTTGYRDYSRNHVIRAAGKSDLAGSSDPGFRGDASCWNPEELLVASLSACHQLWFLHEASVAGVVVVAYSDDAVGSMQTHSDGSGEFTEVVLRPLVTATAPVPADQLASLHHLAHEKCFIARSMNFPVRVEPR